MSRLFVVKKPCVIEREYFEVNDVYGPSDHMACTALKELIDHGFLEEKPIIHGRNKEALDYIFSAKLRAASAQSYIKCLHEYLDKVEAILKEN